MQNYNSKFKDDSVEMNRFKNNIEQRAYELSLNVIGIIDKLQKNNELSSIVSDQLLRSITSIGANIVEAQAGSSRKDFVNFLNHALKSANESIYWLALLKDSHRISLELIEPSLQETRELARILAKSIMTAKGSAKF
jgi:four helix bundle protein